MLLLLFAFSALSVGEAVRLVLFFFRFLVAGVELLDVGLSEQRENEVAGKRKRSSLLNAECS